MSQVLLAAVFTFLGVALDRAWSRFAKVRSGQDKALDLVAQAMKDLKKGISSIPDPQQELDAVLRARDEGMPDDEIYNFVLYGPRREPGRRIAMGVRLFEAYDIGGKWMPKDLRVRWYDIAQVADAFAAFIEGSGSDGLMTSLDEARITMIDAYVPAFERLAASVQTLIDRARWGWRWSKIDFDGVAPLLMDDQLARANE